MTMEDLVTQLKEQHAILTTYLRDQRNKHEDAVIELEEKQENIRMQIVAQHEAEKEKLKKEQAEYISLLQRHHKSINAMIEKSYLEKIRHLKNEYALLQAALRNYKQAVRCDIGKSWDVKVQEIKVCSERTAFNQIRLARQELQRQFEIRKADMTNSFQREVDERVKAQVEIELANLLSRGTTKGPSHIVVPQETSQNSATVRNLRVSNVLLQPTTYNRQTNQASSGSSSSIITSFVENVHSRFSNN